MKKLRITALVIIFALLTSAIPAYATDDIITYDELRTNIDLILPPESAIDGLEYHTYWEETERNNSIYGIEATYEALYDEKPSISTELPTIFTYIYPYNSKEGAEQGFLNWRDDSRFSNGEWIMEREGISHFTYKTGAGATSDYFQTFTSESSTLHYVTFEDNLLIVVAFYRGAGDYERGNVLAYEEYLTDVNTTLEVLESVADYIKEALDFFLDDIEPLGPPIEYDYYLTSASYNLNLSEIYNMPMNGSIEFDMYLDDTAEVGTIIDTIGINEAPYGSISLGINENAILDFNLYDPFTVSSCEDSAGWHHIYTEDSVDLYEWMNVKVEYGVDHEMSIYLNDELQESCDVYKSRSNDDVYLGDFPEDIIEESFVGYIRDFQTTYSTDETGAVSDALMGGIFMDVSPNHPNADAIEYLQEEGVVGGYDDGTFRPDQEVNRAEILKMLLVGLGYEINEEDLEDPGFTDVPDDQWYSKYIFFAQQWNMIDGYDDGSFKPGQTVNRVEFLKILTKAYGIELADYPVIELYEDTELDAWYSSYVQYSKDNELFDIQDYFYPENPVTRGEAAEAIYRLLTAS